MRWTAAAAACTALASVSEVRASAQVGVNAVSPPSHEYDCGMCLDIAAGVPCDHFGTCSRFPSKNQLHKEGCDAWCRRGKTAVPERAVAGALRAGAKGEPSDVPSYADVPDIRVSKGMGSRQYNTLRVSVIGHEPEDEEPKLGWMAEQMRESMKYQKRFEHRWTQNSLSTGLVSLSDKGSDGKWNVQLGNVHVGGEAVAAATKLPLQGSGTVGLLIGDPCLTGTNILNSVWCQHADALNLTTHLPEMLDMFATDNDVDYWGILGDNFYDRNGQTTDQVYSMLPPTLKSKIMLTIPGNHDFWVLGHPALGTAFDQCGVGFAQWYAQDTHYSVGRSPTESPYNLSEPAVGHLLGCTPPPVDNFFFYNQIGNIGWLAQSGAHSWEESLPYIQEACEWAASAPGLDALILMGHWDNEKMGSKPDMGMPDFYNKVKSVKGCDEFESRGMLKFFMGHTHCNTPHPWGNVNKGFRVAGFGMEGCGNFGAPLIDSMEGRLRVWYFPLDKPEDYTATMQCMREKKKTGKGFRDCGHLAEKWIDEPIVPKAGPRQEAKSMSVDEQIVI